MRVRNRMELIRVNSTERALLFDNLLRSTLDGQVSAGFLEKCRAVLDADKLFFLLMIDENAVGALALLPVAGFPGIWEIRSLAMAKYWRRAGLAQFMFDNAVAAVRPLNARRLRATVPAALTAARVFFTKNGFVEEVVGDCPPGGNPSEELRMSVAI